MHRATSDVDTVVEEGDPPGAVNVLLRMDGTEADPESDHRVWVQGTKVEVIHVGPVDDSDLAGIPEKDALFVASHAWALQTAVPCTLVAEADSVVRTIAPVATPAALVAMKLHAIEDRRPSRAQDKRAGDAWDIYRLLVDCDANGAVRGALGGAPPIFRGLVRVAAERILVSGAERTRGWLRAGGDEMAAATADELRFVGQQLVAAL
ncbi:MAG: hypothetical protein ACRDZR_12925 [Acidimicrobiales bacterium]